MLLPWGNEAEQQRAQHIAAQIPHAQVLPKLSLLQAAALLQRAQSIIGVDTGLLHLANAVNRPLVGIYTDSDPNKTGVQTSPWASNHGNIGSPPNVEEIYQAIQRNQQAFQAA